MKLEETTQTQLPPNPKQDKTLPWPQCHIQRKDNSKQIGDIYSSYFTAYKALQIINNPDYEIVEGTKI